MSLNFDVANTTAMHYFGINITSVSLLVVLLLAIVISASSNIRGRKLIFKALIHAANRSVHNHGLLLI